MVSRLDGHIFFVKFSVLKNFTNVKLFGIKSPNFRRSLILTCSFHFWYLQSAGIRCSKARQMSIAKGL